MLTYTLSKTQKMLLSATSRKGWQPNADLQPVENPEDALVRTSRKSQRLTACSKFKACSCQQKVGRTSQMLTYKLFKIQSMLWSARSKKGQLNADLHPVTNTGHALVRNMQEGLARC